MVLVHYDKKGKKSTWEIAEASWQVCSVAEGVTIILLY